MNTTDRIEVGDVVSVRFLAAQYTLTPSAEVLSKPQATGDSWTFKDKISGDIYAVSEGCTITKYNNDYKYRAQSFS